MVYVLLEWHFNESFIIMASEDCGKLKKLANQLLYENDEKFDVPQYQIAELIPDKKYGVLNEPKVVYYTRRSNMEEIK